KAAARPAAKSAKKAARPALKPAARKTVKPAAKKKPAPKPKPAIKPAKPDGGRAEGYPQFTLSLCVRDMEASIRFYQQAFGFKFEFSMPGPDGKLGHAQMSFFSGRIMFSPEGAM